MTESKKPARRQSTKAAESKTKLIKMVRYDGKTADVHHAELEQYRRGGYREA